MKPVDGYSQMEPPHLYYTNRIFLVFLQVTNQNLWIISGESRR